MPTFQEVFNSWLLLSNQSQRDERQQAMMQKLDTWLGKNLDCTPKTADPEVAERWTKQTAVRVNG